jgi:hypothetical protein
MASAATMAMTIARSGLVALAALQAVSCAAISSMPQASVRTVGGAPCFAVPEAEAPREGIRLTGVLVSERESARFDVLPEQLWQFELVPPAPAIELAPHQCVRYGEVPSGARSTQAAKPLVPHRVYVVFMNGKPAKASSVLGYRAEFCVKPAASGQLEAHMVPWDDKAQRWRYDICAK